MIYTVRNAAQSIIDTCDSIPTGAEECGKAMKEIDNKAFDIREEIRKTGGIDNGNTL